MNQTPKGKTISRIITLKTGVLYTDGHAIASWSVSFLFGPLPNTPYRVTYRQSARGPWRVLLRNDVGIENVEMPWRSTPVCFLPRAWIGQRVTRSVTVLPKKRSKDRKENPFHG